MAETAILFSSRYGATKEYALMLRDRTGAVAVENSKLSARLVSGFGTLVLAGGIYMGKIDGLDFFRDNADELLMSHKLAVLAVGIAPEGKDYYARIYSDNFKHHLKGIPLFYARGRLEMDGLSFVDKSLMKTFLRIIKGKKELSGFSKELSECSSLDYMSEDYLDELVGFMKFTKP